jgi:hypothetical protein
MEIHTSEPLILKPTPSEVEIAIAKWKICKSPGSDQILTDVIQAGSEISYILSSIYS